MKIIKKSTEIAGRTLTLEVGRFAQQATAAVTAQYGETMVLATVTASAHETNLDYFPLSIEYVERLYAGGRIKGSRWVKREGRPSDDAVLAGRLIDRSLRPLFPKNYKHEVQVVVTTLSVDAENDPDILGLVAASAAVAISSIPWEGPVAAVRMGYLKNGEGVGNFLVNPRLAEQALSEFDFVVTSRDGRVVMLEGGFCETPEDIVYEAVLAAQKENQKIIDFIGELVADVGQPKVPVSEVAQDTELVELISKTYKKEMEEVFGKHAAKETGSEEVTALAQKIVTDSGEKWSIKEVLDTLDNLFKKKVREDILKKGKRVDGRKLDEIRPIEIEVGVLPRTHGSAVFRRGQTQVLTVATLGTPSLEQLIESPIGEESKRYIHHYSMPPYSVGETGRFGTPSRREIGHGALAERALLSVIPSEEEFPYTIRLVSEIMSSNGSTSMAATCGSTLALMDAGVPIKELVAGISIGVVTEKDKKSEKYFLLTDIMGMEDFAGDMDFKVAGTKNGITAIQLDIKIGGLTDEIVKDTLKLAREAWMEILEKMRSVISSPRKTLSKYAPKVQVVKIPIEKIGEVIGPGGKMIRAIIASTGAAVDVDDDGSVVISGPDQESVQKAVAWVQGLTHDVQVGEEFEGEVKRILPFGAFVEILPGKEGMVHVSQMSTGYVNDPTDVVSLGQKVRVRVIEIDEQRRVNLSMLFGEDAKARLERTPRDRGRLLGGRRDHRPRGRGRF